MECHSCHQKGHFARECPTNTEGRSGNDSRRRRNRRGTPGGCGDRGFGHDSKWPLPPWTDRGKRGQFPGRYGIRGIHPGGTHMEEMGPHGGQADQIMGAAVFGGRTSAGVSG